LRTRRSLLIAYGLWFFLGLLGIHRFYIGRWISGLIWMFTGGLFGIGWLVDAVLTYFMVEEENEAIGYRYVYTRPTQVKDVTATKVA